MLRTQQRHEGYVGHRKKMVRESNSVRSNYLSSYSRDFTKQSPFINQLHFFLSRHTKRVSYDAFLCYFTTLFQLRSLYRITATDNLSYKVIVVQLVKFPVLIELQI